MSGAGVSKVARLTNITFVDVALQVSESGFFSFLGVIAGDATGDGAGDFEVDFFPKIFLKNPDLEEDVDLDSGVFRPEM